MKSIITKLLNILLKEETIYGKYNPNGRSLADIERIASEKENMVWGPEDVSIWFFTIYLNTPIGGTLPRYESFLGRNMGWDSKVIQALQNDSNEDNHIPYKPNVFVRQQDRETATGWVVAENEVEAKKMLNKKMIKYRDNK